MGMQIAVKYQNTYSRNLDAASDSVFILDTFDESDATQLTVKLRFKGSSLYDCGFINRNESYYLMEITAIVRHKCNTSLCMQSQTHLHLVLCTGHWLEYPICLEIVQPTHNWDIIRLCPSRKYHEFHIGLDNACYLHCIKQWLLGTYCLQDILILQAYNTCILCIST